MKSRTSSILIWNLQMRTWITALLMSEQEVFEKTAHAGHIRRSGDTRETEQPHLANDKVLGRKQARLCL